MSTIRACTAALIALALAGASSDGLAQGCVSKGESRELIQQGQVAPLAEAMQRAGLSGQVIDAQLCQGGGGYVYRVRVREGGEVKSLSIPAG